MSSNTRIEAAPPPPPPVEINVQGRRAMAAVPFMGEAGWGMLRQTLDQCLEANQSDEAMQSWAATWKPRQSGRDQYTLELPESVLPAEVRRYGVKGVPVELSLGSKTVETRFSLNFTAARALGKGEETEVARGVQQALIRPVNQLLALTARNFLAQQMQHQQQTLRLRQTVSHRLANSENFTMRTYTQASV